MKLLKTFHAEMELLIQSNAHYRYLEAHKRTITSRIVAYWCKMVEEVVSKFAIGMSTMNFSDIAKVTSQDPVILHWGLLSFAVPKKSLLTSLFLLCKDLSIYADSTQSFTLIKG